MIPKGPPTSFGHSWTSRHYETEEDLQQMQGLLMEGRARTNPWHYIHVGEFTFHFFIVACHLNPKINIRLWHNEDGKLIGFAILGEDPYLDWQVLPEYEWYGIETEVLEWAEDQLRELRNHDPKQWGGNFGSGARQDNESRREFLTQHGFRYKGDFAEVNLLRSLDEPIPAFALPTGVQVRTIARADEIPLRTAAYREVWLPWSDGNVSNEDYACFMRLPAYNRDLDLVTIAPDGTIAAFVNGWIDPVNRIGELGSVGAIPAFRRQGFTRLVLLECLRRMRALGMERACVSTGVYNNPAIRLYESIGFKIKNQYLDYEKAG